MDSRIIVFKWVCRRVSLISYRFCTHTLYLRSPLHGWTSNSSSLYGAAQLVTVDVACERAKCEQRGCLFQCMAAHDGSAGSAADVSLVADSQPPQAPRRTARLDPPWAPPPAPHVDSSNVNQLPGSAPLAALYEWRGSRPPTCTYIYFTLVRCAGPSLNTPVTTNISDKINTISS